MKGAQPWLRLTVNIPRSPLHGRGFKCSSEDPFLCSLLAASIINGQRNIAVVKHHVTNDQEKDKTTGDVGVSDRALREIYLKLFQLTIRQSKPAGVMSSYNKVQGVSYSEILKVLRSILKEEWKCAFERKTYLFIPSK
jgi:beta-glucosidase